MHCAAGPHSSPQTGCILLLATVLRPRLQVLIVGIETHVCVLQTSLDLLGEPG